MRTVAGHAGLWGRFLVAPPGPSSASRCSSRVGDEVAVDDVADVTLERADGCFGSVAFGEFAVVERPAGTVGEAELGDRDDVERMVDRTVPATRQPVRGTL